MKYSKQNRKIYKDLIKDLFNQIEKILKDKFLNLAKTILQLLPKYSEIYIDILFDYRLASSYLKIKD